MGGVQGGVVEGTHLSSFLVGACSVGGDGARLGFPSSFLVSFSVCWGVVGGGEDTVLVSFVIGGVPGGLLINSWSRGGGSWLGFAI